MIKCNLKTVRNHVAKHESFKCNETLKGDWSMRKPMTGKMRDIDNIKSLDSMFHCGDDTFVIKSYETPIAAWNQTNGWWLSNEGHSQITKRHMSAIRMGIN